MSEDLESRLREDRATRNAARALFDADLANIKASLSGRSISTRIVERIGEGAAEVLDEAIEVADNHKGVIATLIAAIILWFARNPIIDLFSGDDDRSEPDGDQVG